ncbi:MAG TPA: hypothetical protein VMT46_09400 [Anaerolineaceae bacterium]|nr:hypothetical protein [Anaerolineaceae bacterium]
MSGGPSIAAIDVVIIVVANLYNLGMAVIFLSRLLGLKRLERGLGLALVALVIPLAAGVYLNFFQGRGLWAVLLPACLADFLLVELLLDYILRLGFRRTPLLIPYLLLYYLGLIAMIGYSFAVDKELGFFTLGTYFINLWATWYSHRQGGRIESRRRHIWLSLRRQI